MKTKLTSLILLASSYLFGQELPDLKAYGKDIGFNSNFILNGIINSYGGSPFDLMLKRQKTSNTSVRYGLNFNAYINSNTNTGSVNSYFKEDQYSLSISLGKEKQKQLSNKWIFYFGGDLAPFYRFDRRQYFTSNQLQNENGSDEFGIRLSPFLGLRFQINERLYLGTEASFRFSYSLMKANWKVYDNFNSIFDETKTNFYNFQIRAIPATGIFVFYRF